MGGMTGTLTGTAMIPRKKILRQIAALAPALIRERSRRGLDIYDTPFAPYSRDYAERRSNAGYNAAPVTLTDSGGLLNGIRVVEVADDHVTIAPGTGQSRSTKLTGKTGSKNSQVVIGQWLHEGGGNLPPRPWLALSPEDLNKLTRQLVDSGAFALAGENG